MLQRVHQKLGTVGFVFSIVALIAALGGAAYAATKLNPTQKKEVRNIAKTEAKKYATAGPQGPKGDPGAAGSQGAQGPAGKDGADGEDGKSVTNTVEPKGPNCAQGGTKLVGTSTTYACNGSPWTAGGTLPPGETETGTWSITNSSMGFMDSTAAISFPIPLAAAGDGGSAFGFNQAETENEEFNPSCPGSLAVPDAKPGFLCVYTQFEEFANASGGFVEARNFDGDFGAYGASGAILHGAFLEGSLEEEKVAKVESYGTWAVTAPLPGP